MFAVFAVVLVALASIATSVLAVDGSGYGGDSVHCTIDANPGVVENGATTLIWWSSENVTSATLEGVGEVDPRGFWWTNGIEADTTYTLTVTTDDGQSATCEATAMLSEESVEHGFCSEVYPGREIADIDGNGWGDTESGENGCKISTSSEEDVVVEEEEESTHDFCSITYPGRVFVDANGDGWGDTESDEAGCIMDPVSEVEVSSHAYCSEVYPGRVIADIDGNGWGDTTSGEEGCKINLTETGSEDVVIVADGSVPSCSVTASPSTIAAGGSTTLSWSGDDSAVSSSIRPFGSTGVFFGDVDPTNEIFITGITDSRTYVVAVTDADGNVGECTVDITVE